MSPKSGLTVRNPEQCNADGARQGKLWHTGGVEYVSADSFRSRTVYRAWDVTNRTRDARCDMILRARDAQADIEEACTRSSVTRTVALTPVPPLRCREPNQPLPSHWHKQGQFERPLVENEPLAAKAAKAEVERALCAFTKEKRELEGKLTEAERRTTAGKQLIAADCAAVATK
jgi:hypothetical protein